MGRGQPQELSQPFGYILARLALEGWACIPQCSTNDMPCGRTAIIGQERCKAGVAGGAFCPVFDILCLCRPMVPLFARLRRPEIRPMAFISGNH